MSALRCPVCKAFISPPNYGDWPNHSIFCAACGTTYDLNGLDRQPRQQTETEVITEQRYIESGHYLRCRECNARLPILDRNRWLVCKVCGWKHYILPSRGKVPPLLGHQKEQAKVISKMTPDGRLVRRRVTAVACEHPSLFGGEE